MTWQSDKSDEEEEQSNSYWRRRMIPTATILICIFHNTLQPLSSSPTRRRGKVSIFLFLSLYFPSGGNLCIPSARLLHSHSGLITIFPVMVWRKETTDEGKKEGPVVFSVSYFRGKQILRYLSSIRDSIFPLPWYYLLMIKQVPWST